MKDLVSLITATLYVVVSGALAWVAGAIVYIAIEEASGGYTKGPSHSGLELLPLSLAIVTAVVVGCVTFERNSWTEVEEQKDVSAGG